LKEYEHAIMYTLQIVSIFYYIFRLKIKKWRVHSSQQLKN